MAGMTLAVAGCASEPASESSEHRYARQDIVSIRVTTSNPRSPYRPFEYQAERTGEFEVTSDVWACDTQTLSAGEGQRLFNDLVAIAEPVRPDVAGRFDANAEGEIPLVDGSRYMLAWQYEDRSRSEIRFHQIFGDTERERIVAAMFKRIDEAHGGENPMSLTPPCWPPRL